MQGPHYRTLSAIFDDPVRANILRSDIEALLISLGARSGEGRESQVRIYLNGCAAVCHRPHPQKETDKGAVKSMRRFLTEAGSAPGLFNALT